MNKLYLHVGLPKCASSTIQGCLASSMRELEDNNLVYPSEGRSVSGYRAHWPLFFLGEGGFQEKILEIKNNHKNKNIILSCEGYAEQLYLDRLKKHHEILKQTFGEQNIHVIICNREHNSFAKSCHKQAIKVSMFGLRSYGCEKTFYQESSKKLGFDIRQITEFTDYFSNIYDNVTEVSIEHNFPKTFFNLLGSTYSSRQKDCNVSPSDFILFHKGILNYLNDDIHYQQPITFLKKYKWSEDSMPPNYNYFNRDSIGSNLTNISAAIISRYISNSPAKNVVINKVSELLGTIQESDKAAHAIFERALNNIGG